MLDTLFDLMDQKLNRLRCYAASELARFSRDTTPHDPEPRPSCGSHERPCGKSKERVARQISEFSYNNILSRSFCNYSGRHEY